ncbi:MAG: SPOR domain-containing protein [Betaproteobacteria bacterium]|nr:SPOR domain-containing protein [Betaproteobacteria bacterium]
MAKAAISQEEIQLRKRARRRLVGASFMVLVMIVILPVILDSEPRPQGESVRVQMPAPVREVQSPPVPESSANAAATETPEQPEPPDLTPPDAEMQEEDMAVADQPAASAPEQTSLVIQLGAFSNPDNARQLKDALLAQGIKAFSEVVKSGSSAKTRVRAGPFDSLAEAERIQARIAKMKLKLGMEPKIADHGQ